MSPCTNRRSRASWSTPTARSRMPTSKARLVFSLSPKDVGRPLQDLEISYRPIELRSLIEQALRRAPPRGAQQRGAPLCGRRDALPRRDRDAAARRAARRPRGERDLRRRDTQPAAAGGAAALARGDPDRQRGAAVLQRGAGDHQRGAAVLQRGAGDHQRGAAVHQRRAGDDERGAAVHQRGAADGQRGAAPAHRRAEPVQCLPRTRCSRACAAAAIVVDRRLQRARVEPPRRGPVGPAPGRGAGKVGAEPRHRPAGGRAARAHARLPASKARSTRRSSSTP